MRLKFWTSLTEIDETSTAVVDVIKYPLWGNMWGPDDIQGALSAMYINIYEKLGHVIIIKLLKCVDI